MDLCVSMFGLSMWMWCDVFVMWVFNFYSVRWRCCILSIRCCMFV